MGTLDGRVAIVTGGSRGIGAAIARRLAAAGASIAINYARDEKSAAETAAAIHQVGGKALVAQADVGNQAQVERLVAQTLERFGRLDILVNNAGILEPKPFTAVNREEFVRSIDTNLWGAMAASQLAAPHMSATGGRIINVSSTAGKIGAQWIAMYAMTKGALNALTRSLAAELGPRGITVNAIAPALVDTDMISILPEEVMEHERRLTPLGRLGRPEDVAGLAAFLASDEASWLTGQVISLDGGRYMM